MTRSGLLHRRAERSRGGRQRGLLACPPTTGKEFANELDGRVYPVHHLDHTAIVDDPDHSGDSVDLQLGGGKMNGFVESFAKTLTEREVQDGDPGRGMGCYNAADLPVYDHLAREFAICDRWLARCREQAAATAGVPEDHSQPVVGLMVASARVSPHRRI